MSNFYITSCTPRAESIMNVIYIFITTIIINTIITNSTVKSKSFFGAHKSIAIIIIIIIIIIIVVVVVVIVIIWV